MKKFLIGLSISVFLASCGGTPTPQVPQDPEAPQQKQEQVTQSDVQQIKNQLEFSAEGELRLKSEAGQVLSDLQLDFATNAIPSLNALAKSDNWAFTEKADGSLRPTGELAVQTKAMMNKVSAQACSSYISSVVWAYRGGTYSATAVNTPTTCGRAQSYFNVMDAWTESMNKTPNSTNWGKVYGTNSYWSMYNQFVCHTDYAFWKDTWNLEPARPNVGYQATVDAACNPE